MSRPQRGWNVEPDPAGFEQACRFLDSAPGIAATQLEALADKGSKLSMIQLGDIYEHGRLGKIDMVEAEKWYRRAADGGLLLGMYELALLLLRTDRSSEALKLLLEAANVDYMPALHRLARMYWFGEGVRRDVRIAWQYAERGTKRGSLTAQRVLASVLLSGAFGTRQRVRGLFLLLEGIVRMPFIYAADQADDRLR